MRARGWVFMFASLLGSCSEAADEQTAGSAEELPSGGAAPAIQTENSQFDRTGTRLMHPEVLNLVIQNSFGFNLSIDANGDGTETNPLVNNEFNPDRVNRETYARYLGGVDYDGDITRADDPDSVMPIVLDRIATSVCQDLLANGTLATATGASLSNASQREAAYQYLSKRLRSRPLEASARASLDRLRTAAPSTTVFWPAACIFMIRSGSGNLMLH